MQASTNKTIRHIDVGQMELPSSIEFNQLVDGVLKLAKKPITGLYQDTLDLVYLSSKKRHVSISGPYLQFLFSTSDKQNQGMIPYETFV